MSIVYKIYYIVVYLPIYLLDIPAYNLCITQPTSDLVYDLHISQFVYPVFDSHQLLKIKSYMHLNKFHIICTDM